LTNTIDTDILKIILSSSPYYKVLLETLTSYLITDTSEIEKVYRKINLQELGKYQCKLDYDVDENKKETEILAEVIDDFSDIIEIDTITPHKIEIKEETFPYQTIFKSNEKLFNIFNIAKDGLMSMESLIRT